MHDAEADQGRQGWENLVVRTAPQFLFWRTWFVIFEKKTIFWKSWFFGKMDLLENWIFGKWIFWKNLFSENIWIFGKIDWIKQN